MKLLWRGSPAARTLWLAPDRSTILDKIIEFAKISAGLSFCVRATLRQWRLRVRPKKMRSKILACLNGRPQKVDMSRLVQNSLRVCWNTTIQCRSQTVALRRHVFFERPFRQTRNFERVFVERTLERHCRNIARTQNWSHTCTFANSKLLSKRPQSRSRPGPHARRIQPQSGATSICETHEKGFSCKQEKPLVIHIYVFRGF